MCGIAGVVLAGPRSNIAAEDTTGHSNAAALELLEAAYCLQHRGQDACGIATADSYEHNVSRHTGLGLLTDVFKSSTGAKSLMNMKGELGIAHMRYKTSGSNSKYEIQPMVSKGVIPVTHAHNGNLTNTLVLKSHLASIGSQSSGADSDSELMLRILARGIAKNSVESIDLVAIVEALRDVYRLCIGAFSCVAMIGTDVLAGYRDANGIKPLVYGERRSGDIVNNNSGAADYMVCSESSALEKLGYGNIHDVKPGEGIFITRTAAGTFLTRKQIVPRISYSPDIFEYVYFASPESVMDGISVYLARKEMGMHLADAIRLQLGPKGTNELKDIDAVFAVPETSCNAAMYCAQNLGIQYSNGLVRNQFISRTFIMPAQAQRMSSVKHKFTAVKSEFADRNVLIIDDSIVRGTTSRQVVQIARKAGARKVFLASSSPAIRHCHVHGIDLGDPRQLIAFSMSNDEIASTLGCDGLVYLQLSQLVAACLHKQKRSSKGAVNTFETGLFSGVYATAVATPKITQRPAAKRLASIK